MRILLLYTRLEEERISISQTMRLGILSSEVRVLSYLSAIMIMNMHAMESCFVL
jgi:hypothetical protein